MITCRTHNPKSMRPSYSPKSDSAMCFFSAVTGQHSGGVSEGIRGGSDRVHQDERGEGAAWGRFCSSFSWQTSIDRLIVIMRFACRLSMKSCCCGRRPSRTWEGDRGDTTCGPKYRTVRRICSSAARWRTPHATINANTAACTQGIGGCPAVLCRHHSPLLCGRSLERVEVGA